MGLVREVFDPASLDALHGSLAMGTPDMGPMVRVLRKSVVLASKVMTSRLLPSVQHEDLQNENGTMLH